MKFDTTILATDNYDLESLIDKSKFFEKYLFEDDKGHISLECATLDSFENIKLLIKFLFKSNKPLTEIYNNKLSTIFDLKNQGINIVTFEELESLYSQWLIDTGRENNMDEFGMLIGFIDYLQRHTDKKFILVIVDTE
jgi:hypothetical protein